MQKYAVIGYPISHSKSPEIYNHLFANNSIDAYYNRISVNNIKEFDIINKDLILNGYNITAPLKGSISPNNIINTVSTTNNEVNIYNTDSEYFLQLIEKNIFINKNILIIGGGETAINIANILYSKSFSFDIILRNPQSKDKINYFNKTLLNILNINSLIHNYDIIINTIKYTDEYLSKNHILQNKLIIDLIYQKDIFSKLLQNCQYISGYDWLKGQAIKSYSYYYPHNKLNNLDNHFILNKKNKLISIIGFMGAGKTTIGKLIAEKLKYEIIDTDLIFESQFGTINNYLNKNPESQFRIIESEILTQIKSDKYKIITTGGGILKLINSRKYLKENTYRIWLMSDIRDSYKRIMNTKRPLLKDYDTFLQLYEERKNLYFTNSDLIIFNSDLDTTINKLTDEIENYRK